MLHIESNNEHNKCCAGRLNFIPNTSINDDMEETRYKILESFCQTKEK
jgi:hypothetical protein